MEINSIFSPDQAILEDARNYTFMTKGAVRVPGIEDVEEFQMTQNAMKVMGISDKYQTNIKQISNKHQSNIKQISNK